ncbi:hypothetical protein [Ancylomarina sp. 16SWW S1-10-2]|uniref:hypothetical protein n=1 Tax=Ancylomarina sp. 16SWW S1-10-2 TaxID=2499681 RepID=UPI0012AE8018|nr:hypothetical protein [Ancylomarina sp. 16SWW S1-10-2]MRT94265.1 hypothetical protein [Ancylomarina sp. 16SWW S1-10-2]
MKKFIYASIASMLLFTACSEDDDNDSTTMSTITQKFENLPDLGNDYVYEGWLIGMGENPDKTSTGRFTNVEGVNYQSSEIDMDKASQAMAYVLTIEPKNETGIELLEPSGLFFSKGSFSGDIASPSTDGALFESGDLSAATGQFFLKAPSVGTVGSDANGIWFIDALPPTKGGFESLPTLTSGWVYEGWVVVNDESGNPTPISTGRFTDSNTADVSFSGAANNNEFKGTNGVPPFPGEDFIADPNNKYSNIAFPIDLTSATIVISIEPAENDEITPFALKPFVKELNNQSTGMVVELMNKYNGVISGKVTR